MKIKNILLYIPRSLYSSLAKMVKTDITEKVKDKIMADGMYHFTPSEAVSDKIIETEYLKPSNIIASYGIPCAYMFAGGPDIDTYIKNLTDLELKKSPYIHPNMVATAVKFFPQDRKSLDNYKFRGFSDEAVVFEGYCILPHNQVEKVKMVPDLVRDEKGRPLKDEKGNLQVAFREATEEELIPNTNEYKAKEDYLNYMLEKAKEYGYSDRSKVLNGINNFIDQTRMEKDVIQKSIESNSKNIVRDFINKIKAPKLEPTVKEVLNKFSFNKKNPYQDKKFAKFVANIQASEDIVQLDLKEVLSEFNKSEEGKYFLQKYNQSIHLIDKNGKHGQEHSSRVAILAMIIAEKEGILKDDLNNEIKDILITASITHDIGRVLDVGPHAKRGAKKIDQMSLSFLNGKLYTQENKNLVMALIEAHEGNKNKIYKMIEKYNIEDPKAIEQLLKLNSILRDADALDRVRLDVRFPKYRVNLKPKYLDNKTSKQLLNASYQLEFLTEQIKDIRTILEYKDDTPTITKKTKHKMFKESIKEDIEPTAHLRKSVEEKRELEEVQEESLDSL